MNTVTPASERGFRALTAHEAHLFWSHFAGPVPGMRYVPSRVCGAVEVVEATGRARCRACAAPITKGRDAIKFTWWLDLSNPWATAEWQLHASPCVDPPLGQPAYWQRRFEISPTEDDPDPYGRVVIRDMLTGAVPVGGWRVSPEWADEFVLRLNVGLPWRGNTEETIALVARVLVSQGRDPIQAPGYIAVATMSDYASLDPQHPVSQHWRLGRSRDKFKRCWEAWALPQLRPERAPLAYDDPPMGLFEEGKDGLG